MTDDRFSSPPVDGARFVKPRIGLASEYKGVVFRSRLEARWAAVFDHYSILWAYEPDVFETPAGPYLPDFLLPDLNTYVEVKPGPCEFNYRALRAVVQQTSKHFLILDSSIIRCREYAFMFNDGDERSGSEYEFCPNWGSMVWCQSEKYLGTKPHDGKQRWYWEQCGGGDSSGASAPCIHCSSYHEPGHFTQIRSMRFENGRAA